MGKYKKVFVCSNDARHLQNLPSNAVAAAQGADTERNAASHLVQWHCLARCPVVYHGVSGADGSITSTFGPTAAVYGGAAIVGVDNAGAVLSGAAYRW